jgi:protein-S-isoprenylcysteine O-methyltransferase Ste14
VSAERKPNHLQAILVLPVTVTAVIPLLLLALNRNTLPLWRSKNNPIISLAGMGLIAGGLLLIYRTTRMFASIGRGTLAPWDPTQKLVVEGVYRYVRNPMHSGVFAILLGEALLTRSRALLLWFLGVTVGNMLYIPLSEEPGLAVRFGDDYRLYQRHVPRWIPRRTPWSLPSRRNNG